MTEKQDRRPESGLTPQETVAVMDETYRNFRDAFVEVVIVGPRREATLVIRPLIWHGSCGEPGMPLAVRFGGIRDFAQVSEKFRRILPLQTEIGFLGKDQGATARKANDIAIRFEAERHEFAFRFSCSSVSVASAENYASSR